MINFYRGKRADYNVATHGRDSLYFATDTREIILNQASYGIDPSLESFVYGYLDNILMNDFTIGLRFMGMYNSQEAIPTKYINPHSTFDLASELEEEPILTFDDAYSAEYILNQLQASSEEIEEVTEYIDTDASYGEYFWFTCSIPGPHMQPQKKWFVFQVAAVAKTSKKLMETEQS